MVYLLCRPAEVKADDFTTSYTPFMIALGGKDAYAAFASTRTARYFAQRLGLDKEYRAVPLSSKPLSELKDAEHALVLRNHAQVDLLLAGKTNGPDFDENLLKLR